MERLVKIDRRILYLVVVILVTIVMLKPLDLSVKVSHLTRQTYAAINGLPEGSLVVLSPMYDPAAGGELNPMLVAMFYHCTQRHYRIIVASTGWVAGPQLVHPLIDKLAEEAGYVYGEDYVELGNKPGDQVWLQAVTQNLAGACLTDYFNRPLDQFPIIRLAPKISPEYVAAVLVLDSGSPGAREWLQYSTQPTGVPLVVGEIQMSVPQMMPFVHSGQFAGLLAGSRGCAEYEQLLGRPGKALKGQDVLSVMALMMVLFIVIGNIEHLTRKR